MKVENEEYILYVCQQFQELLNKGSSSSLEFLTKPLDEPLPTLYRYKETFYMTSFEYFLFLLTLCYSIDPEIAHATHNKSKLDYLSFGFVLSLYNETCALSLKDSASILNSHFFTLLYEPLLPTYLLSQRMMLRKGVLNLVLQDMDVQQYLLTYYQHSSQLLLPILQNQQYLFIMYLLSHEEAIVYGREGSGKHSFLKNYANTCQQNLVFVNVSLWYDMSPIDKEEIKACAIVQALCKDCVIVLEHCDAIEESILTMWKEQIHLYNIKVILLYETKKPTHSFTKLPEYLDANDIDAMALCYLKKPWAHPLLHVSCLELVAIANLIEEGFPEEDAISLCLQFDRGSELCTILKNTMSIKDWLGEKEIKEQLQHLIFMLKVPMMDVSCHTNTILFYGPSGTGKTMAACILGNEAGLPVWQINLSNILDKYVGESEKHLEKLFVEAERKNCILLFDEADVLFARRTSINTSSDRYANSSTAYLLQKFEHYKGIVLLTTNHIQNFDDAFLRRLRFIVRFPAPQETVCREKWQQSLAKLKLSFTCPIKELSKLQNITLAQIDNICNNALYYALENDAFAIQPIHLLKAIKQEYQKRQDQVPKHIEQILKEVICNE